MHQQRKRSWKRSLTVLLAGGCLLLSFTSGAAEVGTVVWQQKYNPTDSNWNNGFFYSVGFNVDGSILVNGERGEADSGSAIGVRYNAETGAVLDTVPEWFLFEYSWSDYAADKFSDQYIDNSGNIYFVGTSYRDSWNTFSARYNVPNIWKFDSSYNNPNPGSPDRPLWKNYFARGGTAAQENGTFNGLAVDSADNIYAVGYYLNLSTPTSQRDWIIDKFDSDGARITGFPLSFNGDNLHDYAFDVAVDSDDNFVVAGTVLVDAVTDHYDWVVRKYSSDGTLVWSTQYDLAGGHDRAISVVVDGDDNAIVAGYRRNALPADDNDWYIVKYAKDGDGNGGATVIWEKNWDDGDSGHGEAYDLVLDNRGFIYIVGSQQKDSVNPLYTSRNRPVVQFRNGNNGDLLGTQNIVLDVTENDRPDVEHDYLRGVALKDKQLAISGYTLQDGGYTVTNGRTGRVIMLELLPMLPIFADGFE